MGFFVVNLIKLLKHSRVVGHLRRHNVYVEPVNRVAGIAFAVKGFSALRYQYVFQISPLDL